LLIIIIIIIIITIIITNTQKNCLQEDAAGKQLFAQTTTQKKIVCLEKIFIPRPSKKIMVRPLVSKFPQKSEYPEMRRTYAQKFDFGRIVSHLLAPGKKNRKKERIIKLFILIQVKRIND